MRSLYYTHGEFNEEGAILCVFLCRVAVWHGHCSRGHGGGLTARERGHQGHSVVLLHHDADVVPGRVRGRGLIEVLNKLH